MKRVLLVAVIAVATFALANNFFQFGDWYVQAERKMLGTLNISQISAWTYPVSGTNKWNIALFVSLNTLGWKVDLASLDVDMSFLNGATVTLGYVDSRNRRVPVHVIRQVEFDRSWATLLWQLPVFTDVYYYVPFEMFKNVLAQTFSSYLAYVEIVKGKTTLVYYYSPYGLIDCLLYMMLSFGIPVWRW